MKERNIQVISPITAHLLHRPFGLAGDKENCQISFFQIWDRRLWWKNKAELYSPSLPKIREPPGFKALALNCRLTIVFLTVGLLWRKYSTGQVCVTMH